jgi:hypothetical protein
VSNQRTECVPSGSIVLLERIDRIRALPACIKRVKLVAPDAHGERLLAEYTFVHTPSLRD